MAESPNGRGVLLFGGYDDNSVNGDTREILELQAGAKWTILDVTLQKARSTHIVLPIP